MRRSPVGTYRVCIPGIEQPRTFASGRWDTRLPRPDRSCRRPALSSFEVASRLPFPACAPGRCSGSCSSSARSPRSRPRSSAGNDPFFVGFSDIAPEGASGAAVGSTAAALGATAVRFTLQWTPGATALTSADAAALHSGVANVPGARVVLSVYGTSSAAPHRRRLHARSTAPTSRTRSPASLASATSLSGTSPTRHSSGRRRREHQPRMPRCSPRCYDTLHATYPGVNIVGLALSHDGNDTTSATSPGAFIRNVGVAYRASGRTARLFDTVGYHPYPVNSAERPWAKHVGSTMIGEGDWNKLMYNLWLAFDGTGQPLPGSGGVSIWYTELGFQTTVPAAKAGLYSGSENVTTVAESGGPADPAHPADSSPAPGSGDAGRGRDRASRHASPTFARSSTSCSSTRCLWRAGSRDRSTRISRTRRRTPRSSRRSAAPSVTPSTARR